MEQRVEHQPLDAAFAAFLANRLDSAGEALRILVNETSRIEANCPKNDHEWDGSNLLDFFDATLTDYGASIPHHLLERMLFQALPARRAAGPAPERVRSPRYKHPVRASTSEPQQHPHIANLMPNAFRVCFRT